MGIFFRHVSFTLTYSEFYFTKQNNQWNLVNEKSILEKEYVDSTVSYINKMII